MLLYIHPLSNHAAKCRAVARQIGLEIEEKTIDLFKGETRSPEYRAISPAGKLPALVDGDLTLFESNAICLHFVARRNDALLPEGPRRAEVFKWMFFESAELAPPYLTVAREKVIKPMVGAPSDLAAAESAMKPLARMTKLVDQALEGKTWLLGDELTLADFSVACQTSLATLIGVDLAAYPNVARQLAQLAELPSWKAAGLAR